jgi:ankyrin repeat protein
MRHADIKALVAKKWTNVNSSDHDGKTALMIAAENDDSTSVQMLLEANADMALKVKVSYGV